MIEAVGTWNMGFNGKPSGLKMKIYFWDQCVTHCNNMMYTQDANFLKDYNKVFVKYLKIILLAFLIRS